MARAISALAIVIVVTALTQTPALAAERDLGPLLAGLQIKSLRGQTPSAFALDGLDGTRVSLADLTGRPALLYFWASW